MQSWKIFKEILRKWLKLAKNQRIEKIRMKMKKA
jgi:hypothetical protein